MTHVTCESKPRSVMRSSMNLCSGNWVAIGRPVVYYAQAANAYSAEIKCHHFTIYSVQLPRPLKSFSQSVVSSLLSNWKALKWIFAYRALLHGNNIS